MQRHIGSAKIEHIVSFLLLMIPVLFLIQMCLALANNGVDIPYADDWRSYTLQEADSFSIAYLFRSDNDTMYPIGKVIDSIWFLTFRGNSFVYQLVTMIFILGSILYLQYHLITSIVRDRILSASIFVSTILALQTGSYWGYQNIAYQQAIPLVCLLAVAFVLICVDWRPATKSLAYCGLGLIAGLSYISGAICALAGAAVLIAIGLIRRDRRDILQAGLALAPAAVITSVAQGYVIIVVQHGQTHRPDAPWATPLESDFWLYALGKVARSLALPVDWPVSSIVILFGVLAITLFAVLSSLYTLIVKTHSKKCVVDGICIFLFLATVTAIYLAQIAAGRTNLRPESLIAPIEIFQFGFLRFHYFWLTIIWPWVLAALLLQFINDVGRPGVRAVAILSAMSIPFLAVASGRFDYSDEFFQAGQFKEKNGIECLQEKLLTSDRLNCPFIEPGDLTAAYAYAVHKGASFVKYVSPSLRKLNTNTSLAIFDSAELSSPNVHLTNIDRSYVEDTSMTIETRNDPMIVLETTQSDRMANCQTIIVKAAIQSKDRYVSQLFYLPLGSNQYSEANSVTVASATADPIELIATSRIGFANQLRFDPITGGGSIRVADLSVRCLVLRN